MKTTLSILIAGIGIGVSVFAAESSREPLADPIPEKIVKGDITIALQRFARVPLLRIPGNRGRQMKPTPVFNTWVQFQMVPGDW